MEGGYLTGYVTTLSIKSWLTPSSAATMGSRERRTRERAETRQRILDAARAMFVRHGYEATTMRAIAQRIEYTPTAIYHHFRNKEALLTELCNLDFRALSGAFRQIGRIEDPFERLLRLGQAYVGFALEHPMQYQLLFLTSRPETQEADTANPGEDAYSFLRETCEELVASGRLRPEFSNPDQVAQIAWSSLHGLLALHLVKQGHEKIDWCDPQTTATRMSESLLRGIQRAGA
jgi:AcrR family transcriptional regulator